MRLWLSERARETLEREREKAATPSPEQEEAQREAQNEREIAKANHALVRQTITHTRTSAQEADETLAKAIAVLDAAEAGRRAAKADPRAMAAQRAFSEAEAKVKALEQALEQARTALATATRKRDTLDVELNPESHKQACEIAFADAKNAAQVCDAAWAATTKAFRKKHRDRKTRKRARELGLTTAPDGE